MNVKNNVILVNISSSYLYPKVDNNSIILTKQDSGSIPVEPFKDCRILDYEADTDEFNLEVKSEVEDKEYALIIKRELIADDEGDEGNSEDMIRDIYLFIVEPNDVFMGFLFSIINAASLSKVSLPIYLVPTSVIKLKFEVELQIEKDDQNINSK